MLGEQSGEMSCPDTHASRQRLDTHVIAIKRAIFDDQTNRAFYGRAATPPCWTERSGFRSAPETRTKPRRFGGSGTREETNVARMRRSNRADGPTIDACGSDAGKEAPVVSRIAGHPRSLAFRIVEDTNLQC